jgi:hypothetical protein
MEEEADSYSSSNSYRDSILKDMKASREEWKWFRIKTRTIAVIKPIVKTILVYYAIQLVFLLWFVNFIIL